MSPHVFFGIPTKRMKLEGETFATFERVAAQLGALGITVSSKLEPAPNIVLARSLLAREFLAASALPDGPTHLLMFDDDVAGWTVDDVVRMVTCGEDVVAAPVPGREANWDRVQRAAIAGVAPRDLWMHASPLLFRELPGGGARFKRGHLLEVEAIGTGFFCVTRRALEATRRYATECEYEGDLTLYFENALDERRTYVGEDYAFCFRWRAAGGIVWADTRTRLSHKGEARYQAPALEDLLRSREESDPGSEVRRISASVDFRLFCPHECDLTAREALTGCYELALDFPDEPPRVLDLGANVGAFAHWALRRWPGARVHCVEPQATMLAFLRRNRVAGISIDDRAVVGRAVTDAETLPLWIGNRNPCCVGLVRHADEIATTDSVPVHLLDAATLPDAEVLKLDVEGGEPGILARYLSRPRPALRGLAVEWHTERDRAELLALLEREGFDVAADTEARGGTGVVRATRTIELAVARAS